MKRFAGTLLVLLYTATSLAAPVIDSARLLVTEQDRVSYSIGADLGENFRVQGLDIDTALFIQGFRDGRQGHTLLTREQMDSTVKNYQQRLLAQKHLAFKSASENNKRQGEQFLAVNRHQPGVVTTVSGLQYKILAPGKGTSPTDQDTVTVEYSGRSIDGTVFDHSKHPISFTVSEVIPGWIEVLKQMKPGARFKVWLPPQLAYGERGMGKVIGPNQTLCFDIHLVAIKPSPSKVTAS